MKKSKILTKLFTGLLFLSIISCQENLKVGVVDNLAQNISKSEHYRSYIISQNELYKRIAEGNIEIPENSDILLEKISSDIDKLLESGQTEYPENEILNIVEKTESEFILLNYKSNSALRKLLVEEPELRNLKGDDFTKILNRAHEISGLRLKDNELIQITLQSNRQD